MRVEIFDADHRGWSECLGRLHHDIYHEPSYVRLEGRRLQAAPEAFLASEGEKLFFLPYLVRSCEPLFPGEALTRPTADVISPYGYPGYLVSEAGREANFARHALQAFGEMLGQRGICSGFFRMHPLLNEDLPSLFPPELFTGTGETVVMDLRQDEDTLWKSIRDGHRWTITKARKAGFVARMVPLLDFLEEFMILYQQTMDRVHATQDYFFDRDYFLQLARMPEQSFCCIVEWEGKIAAACLFFECDGITQAHLGGTKNEFLSKSPFHLLLHHAALWAKGRGSRFLHLGGGVGGANDRLLNFKAGFSPLRFPFYTLRLITNQNLYQQLVELRARADNVAPEALLGSKFFPPYRAMVGASGG